jgi:hypothetical protein
METHFRAEDSRALSVMAFASSVRRLVFGGIVSHKSALKDGELLKIPQFKI